jgi:6-pyruvoyltetrahydropterin/6-carboxytetrahydropterin synthase
MSLTSIGAIMTQFTTRISGRFCAAVQLDTTHPVCGKLHGHDYSVTLTLRHKKLNDHSMTHDYYTLKEHLDAALHYLGHQHLNALPDFQTIQPTSEAIAQWFYNRLKKDISSLQSVAIKAYPDFEVVYHGEV